MTRFALAVVAAIVAIFGTDILIHHFWLMPDYEATKSIWRPEEEMNSRMHWMFIAEFLWGTVFVIIWAKGFARSGNVGTGILFGLLMGLFQAIWVLLNYVLIPMPGTLAAKWFCSGVLQSIVVGIVVALVYRPPSNSSS